MRSNFIHLHTAMPATHVLVAQCSATLSTYIQCCLQLIRLGADVNAANLAGQTPLLLASIADQSEIIKLLLK